MFLQVFSKKVCFCCILGYFAEKKLLQISQILTDGACLEFYEFCVLWEYSSPTDCTDQDRWLVALVVAWVRQDTIPSYICVNPCYLWETLLYKKVLCRSVKSVGGNHSEKVLCKSVKSVGENRSKKAAWVWQGCHTLLKLVLFDEHGGVGGDALHTTGEAKLLCSCCLD